MGKIDDLKTGFDDLANDKHVEVEVDGRSLELDVTVDDLHPIMSMGNMQEPSEDDVERLTDTLRTVLYRSYLPYWDEARDQEMSNLSDDQQSENEEAKDLVESLLLNHYLDIFVGIMEELGWADEADVDGHPTTQRPDFQAESQ